MPMDDAEMLAETESYMIYTTDEDGELIYHVNVDNVTLHLIKEEWDELLELFRAADTALRKK